MHGLNQMKKFNLDNQKPQTVTKFSKLGTVFSTYKTYIIIATICSVVYSIILGFFGIFGTTIQSGLLYFIKNILPYIGIVFGYFMAIFVPVRVIQAMQRNKAIREDIEQDRKLQEHANKSKALQQQILKAMGDKGTF